MKSLLLFFAAFSITHSALSQADACEQATYLPDVTAFCTADAFYTNAGSTASGLPVASCWAATATNDVWFSFIAAGTDLLSSVSGVGDGGTMNRPRIAIYSGSCTGTMNELECADNTSSGITQIYTAGLIPGNSYFIRVSSNPGHVGTFKLCVNNYTPAANPGADCGGATHLCSKNTIGVAQLNGGGANANEPDNDAGTCMTSSFFSTAETNSVWYTWTCGTSGTLLFDITPVDPMNDIDYVLYSLTGTDPCGGRSIIRCNTASCLGTNGLTGLSLTDTDVSEDPGCDAGENAYCQFINMTAGSSYALLINNANGNSGFNLSWGGTGTFSGPVPVISTFDGTICNGESIQFDANSSTNVGGGLTWVFSDGTTVQNQTGAGPFTVAYPTPGNYVAILTGTDLLNCQETVVANITVDNCNSCTVTATNSGNPCPGAAFNLFSTAVTGGTYSWTGPNGYTSSAQNPTGVTASLTPGTYTYTVTVTTPLTTCTSTTTITVLPLPVVNAGADQTVCQGGSVTLSGAGAVSYGWNNGVTNATAFTPAATQTYTVTGTDASGCINTDQVIVTVNPLPTVNAGADQAVCIGGSVTLTGSGAAGYGWNNGVANGVAFTPAATQTYTVTGTDANGCINTDQVVVTVNPLPAITAGADQVICLGTPATLSGGGGVSYTWTNGVTNGSSFNPGLGTTTYTVTGTDANGCINTDIVTIEVVTPPVAVILTSGDLTGTPGLVVGFANDSQSADQYSWDFGNGLFTETTNIGDSYEQTYAFPGIHTITLTASNGICEDTDTVQVIVVPYPPAIIHVPNVFTPDGDGINDFFFIDVENGASIDVAIFNRWGSQLMDYHDFAGKWDGTINGDKATDGTYFFTYTVTGIDGNVSTGHGFVELLR